MRAQHIGLPCHRSYVTPPGITCTFVPDTHPKPYNPRCTTASLADRGGWVQCARVRPGLWVGVLGRVVAEALPVGDFRAPEWARPCVQDPAASAIVVGAAPDRVASEYVDVDHVCHVEHALPPGA